MSRFRLLLLPAVLLAIGGAALDVMQWLRAAPLWVDEQMIALNVRDRAFVDLAGALWLGQSAPLGWLVLQRIAIAAAGTSELVLRFVPVLFGVLTVAAAAWVGLRWMRPLAAALFVVLCAIAPWMSHYRFELKHYSADAFGALVLPALAAWVIEAADLDGLRVRWIRWWALAALLQWVANGAVLVVPGCALILTGVVWRRHGLRAAVGCAATGTVWLVSFAAHYLLSLRHAHHSSHLRDYWAAYVAPWGDASDTLIWLANRFEPLASHPGGASLLGAFWVAALAGLLVSRHRGLAAMFGSVPLAGFALALAGVVPLHDRLALWIVPALYGGIALLADEGLRHLSALWRDRRAWRLVPAAVALGLVASISTDILGSGWRHLDLDHPAPGNHALHDRHAVRWLMDRRQPGDALISTRLGWPAIWWYGDIDIGRPIPRARLADGAVMYEVASLRSSTPCGEQLDETLASHRRALVYVGFPDMPDDFFDRLVTELARYGTLVEDATFADRSRAAVFELGARNGEQAPAAGDECLALLFARRW